MSSLRKRFVVLLVLVTLITGCQGLFGRAVEEEPATPTPIPTPIVPEKPTYVVQRRWKSSGSTSKRAVT